MIKNLKVYRQALIIVDMVNGFVREGVLHDEQIAKIIPRQLELLEENKKRNGLTIFIKDTHEANSAEFKRFNNTQHCIKGTTEQELVEELKPWEKMDDTISIEKNSTSYMEAPAFRKLISNLSNLEQVDVVGCCTDICVANGTIALANYFDQHNLPVKIRVHEDAIATYDEQERQENVKAAKLLMAGQGIKLVKKGGK